MTRFELWIRTSTQYIPTGPVEYRVVIQPSRSATMYGTNLGANALPTRTFRKASTVRPVHNRCYKTSYAPSSYLVQC